jgi:iron complex outermembrane recepter protein
MYRDVGDCGDRAPSCRLGRNGANTLAWIVRLSAAALLLVTAQPGVCEQVSPGIRPEDETANGEQLQEVVVTAQKRAENSQQVPISIATVSDEQLQASGVTSSLQLTTVDPALQVQNQGESFQPRIRGVGTSSAGPGVENPVALYVDGVYYASQNMAILNLNDVAQVSVLDGPQGTLFGRNATGGVIQLTTREPTRESGLELGTSIDNYLTSRTDLYATGGLLSADAVNLWLSYAGQGKSWGDDLLTGQDVHKIDHDVDVRNKWLISIGSDSTLRLNLDYMDRADSNGLNIVPYPGSEAYALLPGYRSSSNPWDVDIYRIATDQLRSGGASGTLETALPFAKFQDIVAYRAYSLSSDFSTTASPLPGEDLALQQRGEEATEELQLVSLDSAKIKWATGLYYFYDNDRSPGTQIDLLPPTFGPVLVPVVVNTRTTTNSVAVFGQATITLPWATELTLGARDTYEHRAFAASESVAGFPVPLPPIAPTITANRPTWRAALDHQFTNDIMGYISYNRGFKSGGYNGFDPTNPPYRPETVDAYEIGAKSELLDHILRINVSAFDNEYKNMQVSRYTTTAVIYNGAQAEIYGADLSAEARVGHFRFRADGEVLRTRFTSFPFAACSDPNFPGPGLTQFSCSATGNQLPNAPSFAGTVSADYIQSSPVGLLDLNVTEYHNAGYFFEPDDRLRQNAYDYLSASISLESPNRRYTARLYGTNLLNRAVYSWAGTDSTQYSADYESPPRLFGARLTYRF